MTKQTTDISLTPVSSREIRLASRPKGMPTAANFAMVHVDLEPLQDQQVSVRNLFMSVDPYMRGRLNEGRSYAQPQEIGAVMTGEAVGVVEATQDPGFQPGDFVIGRGGWQTHFIADARALRKIDGRSIPIQAYLGPVGMPGVTAWYGVNHILAPKAGETLVVSAASGAVGSVVGQLGRQLGARVVGIAGGPEKCAYVRDELGFDACVDHKSPSFAKDFAAATAKGVDALFENVGGEPFAQSLRRINDFGRAAICGLIASYEGAPTVIPDMRLILTRRVRIEGFIVSDHLPLWPQALSELAAHVASGRIRDRETLREGLETAPQAFIDLLRGDNFGKMLVKLI